MPGTNVSTDSDEETETEVDLGVRPPAITIEETGTIHTGVEGSYCYGPMCVDKISPVDLITESQVAFQAIESSRIVIKVGAAVSDVSVGMMTDAGERLKCATRVTRVSDVEYTAELCSDPGRYIVDAGVQFVAGGDAMYYFPIIIE